MIDKIEFIGARGCTDIYKCKPKVFKFPAGECHVSFNDDHNFEFYCNMATSCLITARINNSDDFMHLIMTTETIRNFNSSILLHVTIPYWPAARQDRRNGFESLGCKVYADIINAQKYNSVTIYDAHSDVAPALINNCVNVSPLFLIKRAIGDFGPDYLVAPDAGAAKKMSGYNLDIPIVQCGKKRDPNTGQLSGFEIYGDVSKINRRFLICDDCADGGGTFLGLAKVFEEKFPSALGLYVTHGLFTNGTLELEDTFDKIYFTNSYRTDLVTSDRLEVYQI